MSGARPGGHNSRIAASRPPLPRDRPKVQPEPCNRGGGSERMVFIKGNHEELFLRVLDGEEEVVNDWLTYGGYECAESYGVSQGSTLNATPAEIIGRLRSAVPESHREFLADMADTF